MGGGSRVRKGLNEVAGFVYNHDDCSSGTFWWTGTEDTCLCVYDVVSSHEWMYNM